MDTRNVETIVAHCNNIRSIDSPRTIDILLLTSKSFNERQRGDCPLLAQEKRVLGHTLSLFKEHLQALDHNNEELTTVISYLYLIGPFLTVSSIQATLTEVLRKDILGEYLFMQYTTHRSLVVQYLNLLLTKQTYAEDISSCGYDLIRLILDVFDSIISKRDIDCDGWMLYEIFGKVIYRYLTGCKTSMYFSTKSPNIVVDNLMYVLFLAINQGYYRQHHEDLLGAIVATDTIKYAPQVIRYLALCDTIEYKNLIEHGVVVQAFAASIHICDQLEQSLEYCRVHLIRIAELLIASASKSLKDERSLEGFTSILVRLCFHKSILIEQNMTDLILHVIQMVRNKIPSVLFEKLSTRIRVNYLHIGVDISLMDDISLPDKQLALVVLHKLMSMLPQSLRFHCKEIFEIKKTQYVDPRTILQLVHRLYQPAIQLPTGLDINDDVVGSCIKACLKYGIDSMNPLHIDISSLCIQLVATTIIKMSEIDTGPFFHSPQTFEIYLANIFSMITTHSKFPSLMSSRFVSLKTEVVNLIELCLPSSEAISFDFNIWGIFLSSFNAGMTALDLKLQRILLRYGQTAPEVCV
jgi:hypothetical protein